MGSRFMHLLVADYVADTLQISDKGSMILGSIAPDATHFKGNSHFRSKPLLYGHNHPMNCGQFVLKYAEHIREPFYLGYLSHLVMDDVWTMKAEFSGFEHRVQADRKLYHVYHDDLRLLNAKLYAVYNPIHLYETLRGANEVPDIEEVTAQDVLTYKEQALTDFFYPPEHMSQPLQLFSVEEMIHYVERCKSKALDWCRVVMKM